MSVIQLNIFVMNTYSDLHGAKSNVFWDIYLKFIYDKFLEYFNHHCIV